EWARGIPASDQPRRLSQLPAWWTNRIDPKADPKTAEQLNEMLWALKELSAGLGQTDAALDGVLTQVRESIHPANRSLGALCLGALDAVAHLVDALEDRQYYQVRWAAIHALQVWISRSADFDRELYRTLVENKGYSKDNAAIIRRLLHSFSVAERADPKTYETLIAQLGHDKLAIRELACWHLTRLAPQLARDIRYDPANVEGRVKACEEWRKKLPPGTVPSPPKSPTGAGARRSQETSNKSTWLTRAARSSAITSVASGELSGEHHRVEGPGHDR
ncbi:MAG TPA: hypothetical protein VKU02_27530, partial [Gemmataceae bacterium]|nr:hypothetical protein [Gemmataceae bacterium]